MVRCSNFDINADTLDVQLSSSLSGVGAKLSTLKDHRFFEAYSEIQEQFKENIRQLLLLLKRQLTSHPIGQKCQEYSIRCYHSIAARMYPIIAKISKNSFLAGSIGFTAGVFFGFVLFRPTGLPSPMKPQKMRAIISEGYEGLDGLLVSDVDAPRITELNEVLIRVEAASVDQTDALALSGYGRNERTHPSRQVILGRDFSGTVMEVGRNVHHLKVGDAVWGTVPITESGTLCEYLVLPAGRVELKPERLGFDGAATVPFSGLNTWSVLQSQGHLGPANTRNKTVFIVDGTSSTGCLAIQLVRAWGGEVVTCVPYRFAPLAQLMGAHYVIPIMGDVSVEQASIEDACEKHLVKYAQQIDVVVVTSDLLSDDYCQTLVRDRGGIMVSTRPPRIASDSYGMLRRWWIRWYRRWVYSPYGRRRSLQKFADLVEAGEIQPVLDSCFTLDQAQEAFQHILTGQTIGKTIITFRPEGTVSS